jgi:hypothetical protein
VPDPDADEDKQKKFGRGHLGHEFLDSLENDLLNGVDNQKLLEAKVFGKNSEKIVGKMLIVIISRFCKLFILFG